MFPQIPSSFLNSKTNRFSRIQCGVDSISAIYNSTANSIYIANVGYAVGDVGDGITIINPNTLQKTGAINSITYPFGFANDPTTDYLYVCEDTTVGKLFVINPVTNTIITNIAVGTFPLNAFIYAGAYPSKIVVSNFGSNDVSIIDPLTYIETARISSIGNPYTAAYCPTDGYIYIASRSTNSVFLIDPASWTISTSIALDGGCIGVVYVASSDRVYVTNTTTGTISVINPTTHLIETTIIVGGLPREIILNPHDSYLYVSNRSQPYLTVINPASNTIIKRYYISITSSGLGYCPPTNSILATSIDADSLFVCT